MAKQRIQLCNNNEYGYTITHTYEIQFHTQANDIYTLQTTATTNETTNETKANTDINEIQRHNRPKRNTHTHTHTRTTPHTKRNMQAIQKPLTKSGTRDGLGLNINNSNTSYDTNSSENENTTITYAITIRRLQ
jgi:hypothetical protein